MLQCPVSLVRCLQPLPLTAVHLLPLSFLESPVWIMILNVFFISLINIYGNIKAGAFFLDPINTKCPVLGFKDSLNFPHLAGNTGKSDLMAMS